VRTNCLSLQHYRLVCTDLDFNHAQNVRGSYGIASQKLEFRGVAENRETALRESHSGGLFHCWKLEMRPMDV